MKQILLFVFVFFLTVTCLYSQTSALYETPKKADVLFGVVSPDPGTFQEILDFLSVDNHVIIYSYCRKDFLIHAQIDLRWYKNAEQFARHIELSFPGAAYYHKNCSDQSLNSYFKECYGEIVKPY
jgi:hypothetical protein